MSLRLLRAGKGGGRRYGRGGCSTTVSSGFDGRRQASQATQVHGGAAGGAGRGCGVSRTGFCRGATANAITTGDVATTNTNDRNGEERR